MCVEKYFIIYYVYKNNKIELQLYTVYIIPSTACNTKVMGLIPRECIN